MNFDWFTLEWLLAFVGILAMLLGGFLLHVNRLLVHPIGNFFAKLGYLLKRRSLNGWSANELRKTIFADAYNGLEVELIVLLPLNHDHAVQYFARVRLNEWDHYVQLECAVGRDGEEVHWGHRPVQRSYGWIIPHFALFGVRKGGRYHELIMAQEKRTRPHDPPLMHQRAFWQWAVSNERHGRFAEMNLCAYETLRSQSILVETAMDFSYQVVTWAESMRGTSANHRVFADFVGNFRDRFLDLSKYFTNQQWMELKAALHQPISDSPIGQPVRHTRTGNAGRPA